MKENTLDYAPKPRYRFPWKAVILISVTAAVAVPGIFIAKWVGRLVWDWRLRQAHDLCAMCVLDPAKATLTFGGSELPFSEGTPASDGEKAVETLQLGLGGTDLVFAHERRTRSGAARIVILQLDRLSVTNGQPFFTYHVLGPGIPGDPKGLLSSDDVDVYRWTDGLSIRPVATHPMNIYYGQADPKDESHFWFDYDIDGKRGTVDGNLEDNPYAGRAEWVRLTDRKPPATGAAATGK